MRRGLCLGLLSAMILTGCGGPRGGEVSPTRPPHRLVNQDRGLQLRQWIVADDSDAIRRAVQTHGQPADIGIEARQRLERNGLRMITLPTEAVEPFLADLGGTTLDVDAWYGQVFTWQELHATRVSDLGQAVAVNGRVRRYVDGRWELAFRGWSLSMEDGSKIYLQVVPQYQPAGGDLRRLLEPARAAARPVPSLNIEMLLNGTEALVITGAAPDEAWTDDLAEAETDDPGTDSDSDPMGPVLERPPTLGELLLVSRETTPPTRGMLVLVPRLLDAVTPEAPSANPLVASPEFDDGSSR